MNNNLIPTVIVDKNGKTTTVHRKADRTATRSAIPVPTVKSAKNVPEKPSTPLPVPKPVKAASHADLKRHADRLRSIDALSLRKNPNADEVALIDSILERGILEPKHVCALSDYMGLMSQGEKFRDYDYNTFLLAERYVKNGGNPSIFNYTDMDEFKSAIGGLYKRRRESDIKVERFTTEEELDSAVALLRLYITCRLNMTIREYDAHRINNAITSKRYQTTLGQTLNGSFFRNQAFTECVRENYESYPDIERYVRDRGVPKNKQEVQALRDYLDNSHEHTAAIAEGWL